MIDIDTIDALLRLSRAREEPMDTARMILARGYLKRKTGVRQTGIELKNERDSFQALRHAGVESDPEICYFNAIWDAEYV